MIRDSIDLFRYFRYRLLFPKSKISYGAYVDKNSMLSTGIRVAPGAKVYNSEIGPGVIISENCLVTNSKFEKYVRLFRECWLWEVQIGAYSYIAPRAELSMTRIGRFCSIGARFQCSIGNHPTDFVSTSPVFFSILNQCGISFTDKELFKERIGIKIGNDVWIGHGVSIRDGVKIGNGAVIAAAAAVVKDVPDYAIVGGVPAKLIRYRFPDEIIAELLKIQWWNWSEEKLRLVQPLMVQSDMMPFIEWAHRVL